MATEVAVALEASARDGARDGPSEVAREGAQYRGSRLAGPYGHPVHPALVAVPIGAWTAVLIFDVGSHLADARALAEGARWLLGLGVAGALAAAAAGLLDLLAVPPGTKAMRIALWHAGVNVTATAIFGGDLALRLGALRAPVPLGLVALTAVGMAVLAVGGWLGGELAYRHGVRVAARPGAATTELTTEGLGK